jgi:hypothetical protein
MSKAAATETKNEISIARKVSMVFADTNSKPRAIHASKEGDLPSRFELLHVGMWRTPWHGDIAIFPDDLQKYVDNFNAGLARADKGDGTFLGLPINFGHEQGEEAAGWINALVIEGNILYADQVEWTAKGAEGLRGGEWKCISPEFYPAGRGGWCDPLNYENYVENVLEGAALTNIPLFRNMKPVMASVTLGDEKTTPVFIFANVKENVTMNLDEIRLKNAADLNDQEREFVAANKDQLSDDEKQKFGLVTADADPTDDKDKEEPEVPTPTDGGVNASLSAEDAGVLASIRSGEMKLVKADTLSQLEEVSQQYRTDKATQIVKGHIARGAIKADQESKWVDKLLASRTKEDRAEIEALMHDLPDNEMFAVKGDSTNAGNATTTAADEVRSKANDLVKAAKEAGESLDIATAITKVFASDRELEKRYNQEVKE